MQFKLLHCWDCGNRIIDGDKPGPYTLRSTYRLVRFGLGDGSYCEPGFCDICADKPWPVPRMLDLERAVNATRLQPQLPIRIVKMESVKTYTVVVLEP